jgi:hypothetical protein
MKPERKRMELLKAQSEFESGQRMRSSTEREIADYEKTAS